MYSGKEGGEIILFLTAGSFLFFTFRFIYFFLQNRRTVLKKGIFLEELALAWTFFFVFTLFFLLFLFILKRKEDIKELVPLVTILGCFLVVYSLIVVFSIIFSKIKIHYSNWLLILIIVLLMISGILKVSFWR